MCISVKVYNNIPIRLIARQRRFNILHIFICCRLPFSFTLRRIVTVVSITITIIIYIIVVVLILLLLFFRRCSLSRKTVCVSACDGGTGLMPNYTETKCTQPIRPRAELSRILSQQSERHKKIRNGYFIVADFFLHGKYLQLIDSQKVSYRTTRLGEINI